MAPKKAVETEAQAREAALDMLARKARSAREVAAGLQARGAPAQAREAVLGKLRAEGLLDDARLAADQAAALLDGKGLAPAAAVESLVARGVEERTARDAVGRARAGREETALCAAALARRLHGRPLAPSAAEREARALARLGWDEDLAARIIEKALAAAERAAAGHEDTA